jgi:hypothetical protein
MSDRFVCCNERRRALISQAEGINGIDYLEVLDDPSLPAYQSRVILQVHFFKTLKDGLLDTLEEGIPNKNKFIEALKHIRIEGGEKIKDVEALNLEIFPHDYMVARIRLNQQGDLSTYHLRIIGNPDDPRDIGEGFDPVLFEIDFRFRPECGDLDQTDLSPCPPRSQAQPNIDYLAKDYASFRQLMLDRISLLKPLWTERNPSDLGVALVELLAYVGDHLSYQQDAVATEAYLDTARHRISVRRHARLVDYFMHDGCNARTWIQVKASQDILGSPDNPALPVGTQLLTRLEGQPDKLPKVSCLADQAQAVFETMVDLDSIYEDQNEMDFYTWGEDDCCIPLGATSTTLLGCHYELQKGDVLIFKEVCSPRSGRYEDADPSHCHAIRLIKQPRLLSDPLGGMIEGLKPGPLQITEIVWGNEDALPFHLCVSANKEGRIRVSKALGNIVPADHGQTVRAFGEGAVDPKTEECMVLKDFLANNFSGRMLQEELEALGSAKGVRFVRVSPSPERHCEKLKSETSAIMYRFTPRLRMKPVTQAAHLFAEMQDSDCESMTLQNVDMSLSARAIMNPRPEDALSSINVFQVFKDKRIVESWNSERDLLSSGRLDRHFVAEIDDEGYAVLRFGDGVYGAAPEQGSTFYARYRTGNGISGNVGAGSIAHILSDDPAITGACNPMPARGGTEAESIDEVRMKAPVSLRTLERAVTLEDYAVIAERFPEVEKAAATFHWTGSWHTINLTIDRKGGLAVDEDFKKRMLQYMERFRMTGHDLLVEGPIYVSLDLDLTVCIKPEYYKSHIKSALLQVLGSEQLANGRLGIFHPDRLTFGQTIYLSSIYEAALSVEGVESVEVTRFIRRDDPGSEALNQGYLAMRRLEIARLDNDLNFPENGIIKLNPKGGR